MPPPPAMWTKGCYSPYDQVLYGSKSLRGLSIQYDRCRKRLRPAPPSPARTSGCVHPRSVRVSERHSEWIIAAETWCHVSQGESVTRNCFKMRVYFLLFLRPTGHAQSCLTHDKPPPPLTLIDIACGLLCPAGSYRCHLHTGLQGRFFFFLIQSGLWVISEARVSGAVVSTS